MNRIILIGNGFDLAHGLPTRYAQFIDKLWEDIVSTISEKGEFDDNLFSLNIRPKIKNQIIYPIQLVEKKLFDNILQKNFQNLKYRIDSINTSYKDYFTLEYQFKNSFFEHLTTNCIGEKYNWVDIEEEYYKFLCNSIDPKEPKYNYKDGVKQLNADFENVKMALCDYLSNLLYNDIQFQKIKPLSLIQNIFNSSFVNSDFLATAEIDFFEINNKHPEHNLFINVNYTRLESLYITRDDPKSLVIHLHGLVNNENENFIVFGYGNNKDVYYPQIKKLDNEDLKNIKSTQYTITGDYRQIVEFINSDNYQIIILGHSCGNSDGDLLNLLFENSHCKSIKPYFFEEIDKNGKRKNNHNDMAINISRHFYKNENHMFLTVPENRCSAFSIKKEEY